MTRQQPVLEDPVHASTDNTHAQIRNWMESVTSHNPYVGVDWQTYNIVSLWAERGEYRKIVEEVLKQRLGMKGLPAEKALILTQALPPASLATMTGLLKPLSAPVGDTPPSLFNNIAAALIEAGEKVSTAEGAKAADAAAKFPWDAWCEKYGRPDNGWEWRPLPAEPVQWGMWGMVWVTPDQWWISEGE